MKFIILKNVKMPTIIGILTSISMVNETYETENKKVGVFKQFSL